MYKDLERQTGANLYFDHDEVMEGSDIPLDTVSVESGIADTFRAEKDDQGDMATIQMGVEGSARVEKNRAEEALSFAKRFYNVGLRGKVLQDRVRNSG